MAEWSNTPLLTRPHEEGNIASLGFLRVESDMSGKSKLDAHERFVYTAIFYNCSLEHRRVISVDSKNYEFFTELILSNFDFISLGLRGAHCCASIGSLCPGRRRKGFAKTDAGRSHLRRQCRADFDRGDKGSNCR